MTHWWLAWKNIPCGLPVAGFLGRETARMGFRTTCFQHDELQDWVNRVWYEFRYQEPGKAMADASPDCMRNLLSFSIVEDSATGWRWVCCIGTKEFASGHEPDEERAIKMAQAVRIARYGMEVADLPLTDIPPL